MLNQSTQSSSSQVSQEQVSEMSPTVSQNATGQQGLPSTPTNRIFTGVAGTGKTYHLLQLQRLYDTVVDTSEDLLCHHLLRQSSWREVICAVLLLESRAMKVSEIVHHPLLQAKAQANNRQDNLSQTVWGVLLPHSLPQSQTVKFDNSKRASVAYFDQTSDKAWFLLDSVVTDLSQELAELIHAAQMYGLIEQQNLQVIQQQSNTHTASKDQYSKGEQLIKKQNTVHLSRSRLVSFHQSYGYDDFVEGIRPRIDERTGQMRYDVQAGAFLQLCEQACANPQYRYAMLIDEINRANVAQVFGELMSVIEPDKRAGQANAMQVQLAYSGRLFSVPSNVDIYATMNTQDHSLVTLDMAFRRRFEFVEMQPDSAGLGILLDNQGEQVDLAALMDSLNVRICQVLGAEAQLGQAFFYNIDDIAQLAQRFALQILPQIISSVQGRGSTMNHLLAYILYGLPDVMSMQDIKGALLVSDIGIKQAPKQQGMFLASPSPAQANLKISPQLMQAVRTADNILIAKPCGDDFYSRDMDNDIEQAIFLTAQPYQNIYQLSDA